MSITSNNLKDGRDAPHVDEPGSEVLTRREEEGEERDPEAEGEQQELRAKLLFSHFLGSNFLIL